MLQPKPWFNGRVVLLAEELARHASIDAALEAYQDRRFDCCRDVVETSVTIGRLQLEHGDPGQIAGLTEGALTRLDAPFRRTPINGLAAKGVPLEGRVLLQRRCRVWGGVAAAEYFFVIPDLIRDPSYSSTQGGPRVKPGVTDVE